MPDQEKSDTSELVGVDFSAISKIKEQVLGLRPTDKARLLAEITSNTELQDAINIKIADLTAQREALLDQVSNLDSELRKLGSQPKSTSVVKGNR